MQDYLSLVRFHFVKIQSLFYFEASIVVYYWQLNQAQIGVTINYFFPNYISPIFL